MAAKLPDVTLITDPATEMHSSMTSKLRRPKASPSLPDRGAIAVPTRRKMVIAHETVSVLTLKTRMNVGTAEYIITCSNMPVASIRMNISAMVMYLLLVMVISGDEIIAVSLNAKSREDVIEFRRAGLFPVADPG
jgi:hypothetical protein